MEPANVKPINRINFAPESVREEVVQNVATIISTMVYTVPYDRDFGVKPDFLDDPSMISRSKLIAEIVAKIKKHEPRAKVVSVSFDEDGANGRLKPTVRIDIDE